MHPSLAGYAASLLLAWTGCALAQPVALTQVTLIDGTGKAPVPDATVLVNGDRIVAAGPARSVGIPADARVISKPGKFVIPGLMDVNVHLTAAIDAEPLIRFEHDYHRIAVQMAQINLKSGVTSVFDTWGRFEALQTARDRIRRGESIGSRIFFSGNIIGFDGPLSSDFHDRLAPVLSPALVARVNDSFVQGMGSELSWLGPEQVREHMRAYAARPMDFLKYGAGAHKQMQMILFSPRVQRVLVEEAHRAGKTVQAHATSTESLDMALDAGVDILTHCEMTGPHVIPPDTLRKMRQRGVYCSVLPMTQAHIEDRARAFGQDALFVTIVTNGRKNLRHLIQTGVPLMVSTDGVPQYPDSVMVPHAPVVDARETFGEGIYNALLALEELGMPAMQVLQSASLNVAKGYRLDRDLGSIQPGKLADLVVLDRDPLASARHYRAIDMVMKGGVIVDRAALPDDPVLETGISAKP